MTTATVRCFFASGRVGEDELRRVAAAVSAAVGTVSTPELQATADVSKAKPGRAVADLQAVGAVELRPGAVSAVIDEPDARRAAAEAAEVEARRQSHEIAKLEIMGNLNGREVIPKPGQRLTEQEAREHRGRVLRLNPRRA